MNAGKDPFIPDESKPSWNFSPWKSAIDALCFGEVNPMAQLLEKGEPIPQELGKILANALIKNPELPFRFELIANPRKGSKRSGRRPEKNYMRDIMLAARMFKRMQEGQSYDEAATAVAEGEGMGDRTIKLAYNKYRHIAEGWAAYAVELKENTKKITGLSIEEILKIPSAQPLLQKWMIGGDKD